MTDPAPHDKPFPPGAFQPPADQACDVFPTLRCTPKREQCQAFCIRQGEPGRWMSRSQVPAPIPPDPEPGKNWEAAMRWARTRAAETGIRYAVRGYISPADGRWRYVAGRQNRLVSEGR